MGPLLYDSPVVPCSRHGAANLSLEIRPPAQQRHRRRLENFVSEVPARATADTWANFVCGHVNSGCSILIAPRCSEIVLPPVKQQAFNVTGDSITIGEEYPCSATIHSPRASGRDAARRHALSTTRRGNGVLFNQNHRLGYVICVARDKSHAAAIYDDLILFLDRYVSVAADKT